MEFDVDSSTTKMLDDIFNAFMIISRREYVYAYDVKEQIIRFSPAAAKLFGFPEYIPYGFYNWEEYLHPEDRRKYRILMSELLEGKAQSYDINYRVLLNDGSYITTRNIGAVILDKDGKSAFLGGVIINEGVIDNTDPVTVLRNQYGFFQDLSAAIELKKFCSIILIGISKMSLINLNHGYNYGNRVLQNISLALQEMFSLDGMVYRMDGAKFAFLTETLSPEEIMEKYEEIRRSMLGGLSVDEDRQSLVLNAGMFTYDGSYFVDERTIFSGLNLAYHNSKKRYNGKIVNYGGAFGFDTQKSIELINEVRNSIVMDCEGFSLRYQPIFSAEDEKIIAAEALLCWKSENFGEVSPEKYIPVIERDFLFEELGYWIFHRAMSDGLKILEKNPDFLITINIAPAQITDEFLIDELVYLSERLNFPLKNLCFELTAYCREIVPEILKKVIFDLKSLGVKCLLDDFGSGVGSIDFLQILAPEYIKPKKKYIFEMEENARNQSVVQHLTNMAVELGTKVCIKGVATKNIRNIIKNFPIAAVQGHFFSEPIPFDELMKKYF